MSTASIGAVVRCGDAVAGVYDSLRSLLSSARPPDRTALVVDTLTTPRARPWLRALAASRGAAFVEVEQSTPGVAWNAGLRAIGPVDYGLCLEAGDVLDRDAIRRMAVRFEDDAVALTTTGIEWVEPVSHRRFTRPDAAAPLDLLKQPEVVHVSTMFRWRDWSGAGGFDEDMAALEFADLWLRILQKSGIVAVEADPLLRRQVSVSALYRRSWTSGGYRDSAARLFANHRELVQQHLMELLEYKERAALEEHTRNHDVLRSRRAAEEEIESLTARTAALQQQTSGRPDDTPLLFERVAPKSYQWGYDRGTPVDRPLIEAFLSRHARDIHGVALEIQENDYTRRFGGASVERADVLDAAPGNERATFIADLRAMPHVSDGTYDCIVLTQTLQLVDDMHAVVAECFRILKPGGVLLATMPAASRLCLEYGGEGDYWRVTEAGARRLFAEVFPPWEVETRAFGNAPLQSAFAFGLASEELPAALYRTHDVYVPVLVGVRARKPPHERAIVTTRADVRRAVVLMYHRVGARGPDPHRLSISEPRFREQMEWLADNTSVISLDRLIGSDPVHLRGRPAVVLTFDDGYADALTVAALHLRRLRLPATFFLTTPGEAKAYWWDELAHAFLDGERPASITVDLPSGRTILPTATFAERELAHWHVYRSVNQLGKAERDDVVAMVVQWASGPRVASDDRRMTWDEVRALAGDPLFTIGAHTVDHLFLPAQPDDVLRRELADSRATLESQLSCGVDALAYPFGGFDKRVVNAARDTGYRTAVTCEAAVASDKIDPLAIPRIEIVDDSLGVFRDRVLAVCQERV